jgi:hypothetical protein
VAIEHSAPDYVQQAAHNVELADYLRKNRTDCLDWAVTCLFYAAVHYVNAYLRKSNLAIPRRHRGSDRNKTEGRLNIVQQDPTLRFIYINYRHLDDESRDARYELRKPSSADYDSFLEPQLKSIRKFILPKVTN